jgi:hypothetical protein
MAIVTTWDIETGEVSRVSVRTDPRTEGWLCGVDRHDAGLRSAPPSSYSAAETALWWEAEAQGYCAAADGTY